MVQLKCIAILTNHAQNELGDIVFVELPCGGDEYDESDAIGTIEAVKTVAEIYVPFDCIIEEVNENLEDDAGIVNSDPYGDGWIVKVRSQHEKFDDSNLLTVTEYEELIQ